MPVKDVAEAAKQYVKVLETPEFRTTELCAGCWREASKCGKSVRSIGCIHRVLRARARVRKGEGCERGKGKEPSTCGRHWSNVRCGVRVPAVS